MTSPLQLKVLTPDKFILETEADDMRVLLPDGWWGILPGHAPMISNIHSGIVHYTKGEQKKFVALYQGTVEVRKIEGVTEVLILTSAAEEGDSLEAVRSALEQQAARLAELEKEANREFNRVRLALERSIQQVNIQEKV